MYRYSIYILIFSTLLLSSSDAQQGEVKYVIKPQFDDVWSFSEGLALVKIGDRYGFINKEGQYVVNPQFDNAGIRFSEGLVHVIIGDKWGYINKEGQVVIKPQFDSAGTFSEGLARVKTGDKWGYISKASFEK